MSFIAMVFKSGGGGLVVPSLGLIFCSCQIGVVFRVQKRAGIVPEAGSLSSADLGREQKKGRTFRPGLCVTYQL
jgi:hypothetical protein